VLNKVTLSLLCCLVFLQIVLRSSLLTGFPLHADDLVLLADYDHDLQAMLHVLHEFAVSTL
jgi:hypothetical protein